MRDITDSVVTIESVNVTGEKVDGDWVCESCNYTTSFSSRPPRKDCIIKGDNCIKVCEECSTVFLEDDSRGWLSKDYYKGICGNCNNIIEANFVEYHRIINTKNIQDEVNEGTYLPIAIKGHYDYVPHDAGWPNYFYEFQIHSDEVRLHEEEKSKRELTAKRKRIEEVRHRNFWKVWKEAWKHAHKTKQKCDIMEVFSEQEDVPKEYYFTTDKGDVFPLGVKLETQNSKKINTVVCPSFWERIKNYFGKL